MSVHKNTMWFTNINRRFAKGRWSLIRGALVHLWYAMRGYELVKVDIAEVSDGNL